MPRPPDTPPAPDSLHDALQVRPTHTPVTWGLIALNVGIFLLMLFAGAGLWHPDNSVQLAWGANFGPATQDGEWWRLGSALFLHFGLIHLAMNQWALRDGGQYVERIYGARRFAAIYLLSGLFGNLLSLVTQGNEAISGGASGAIFGVYGALLAYLWRERRHLHPAEFRWLFWSVGLFTLISMGLGLVIDGIDNSAHLGGLLCGTLLGTVLARPLLAPAAPPALTRMGVAGLLLAGVAVLLASLPEPRYRWQQELAARQEIRSFLAQEAQIQASWQEIQHGAPPDFNAMRRLAQRIESEIATPYRDSFAQLSQLELDPHAPSAGQLDALRQYSAQRRDFSQALAEQLRTQAWLGPHPAEARR